MAGQVPGDDSQVVADGRQAGPGARAASFARRAAALVVDAVVAGAAVLVLVAWTRPAEPGRIRDALWLVMLLALVAVGWTAYDALTSWRLGGTLGKRLVGIRVCDRSGSPPSFGRALGRSAARFLSSVPFGLGYLAVLWDPAGRAWHDALAGTWVGTDASVEGLIRHGSGGEDMSEDFRRTGSDPPSDTTPVGPAPSPGRAGAQDGAVPPEGPGPVHSDEPAASWREEGPGDFSNATAPPPPGADPAGATRRQRDPNVDAIARAGLAAGTDAWLREVASQVDPRLDRCAPGWRTAEQAGAARACVFGLMLGRLANDYPHTSGDLGRVAESHPSFATLTAGSRLATLREIADDRHRGATWIAPLVGLDDPAPLRDILD